MSVFDSPFSPVFRNPFGSAFNSAGLGGGGVVVDESVDLLFDIAFQAGIDPVDPTSVGIWMTDPNTGPGGNTVLEQVVPASFFGDGEYGEAFFNAVYARTTPSYGTYVYVNAITSQLSGLGLDDAGSVARVYQRDVLIDSISSPTITPRPELAPPQTGIEFTPLGIEFDEHDHYRVRIFDQEPPVDMQMLFGVEGVAGEISGSEVGIIWDSSGASVGAINYLSPPHLVLDSGGYAADTIISNSGANEASVFLVAPYSEDRNNIVSVGTHFEFDAQPVTIRIYGDGELLGETESTFYYGDGGYTINPTFSGVQFTEGQTIAVRGWVPTSSVQHFSPVAIVPPTITGTLQEGETINLEGIVWASQFQGLVVERVQWVIYDDEGMTSVFSQEFLDYGIPYTLPAGSGGKWLAVTVTAQAQFSELEIHTGSVTLPIQQIAAP